MFGFTEPRTGIEQFLNLVTQVMSQEPYAGAKRVFWIVDNRSSHRGQTASERLTGAFPNAVVVHTPAHASWLNQVGLFFSVVQRKVVSPNDFSDLKPVANRLRAFEDRYNSTAVPVEVHHLRPERSAGPARPAHHRSPGRILRRLGSMINPRRTSEAEHYLMAD
ncbi:transposase [Streptomyces sp. NPDC005283]|uniref:transposase n=1 Tax=Streptomyces sp. NPDC005283 TaxID=3156871 RepID=UPI003454EB78